MALETPSTGNSPAQLLGLMPRVVSWYFHSHILLIIRAYLEYASAFRESFSIFFLLKTLFSPWKSIKDSYPQKGFNLQAIVETYFLNVTTRCIGACIRSACIFAGIVIQVVLLLGCIAYVMWWIFFPFLLIALPFYLVLAFFQ